MKKTKLLTSLAALALVVGLGGCSTGDIYIDMGDVNINGGDNTSKDTSEEDTTSESTSEGTSPSESTSEGNSGSEQSPKTSIEEFIFIVTLYVDGNADSVPDYGTLYYKGGLNGELDEDGFWCDGDYVSLTETQNSKGEVAYTATFNNVQVRDSYDFSLLFYYSDETVGSSYSSHVVASYISSPLPETGDTGEYEVTLNTSLTEKFPNPNASTEVTGDPVADLLADVKENNNYSLTIEYYDWTSPTYDSESGMYQDFENDTISKNSARHYNVVITFTKDVMFLEYYYGLSTGSVYDIESYINNGNNMEVWWCSTSYSTTLVKQTSMTESNQSWQNKWKSETLLGLDDSLFSVDTSSYDGSKVDYTVNIDSYTTLTSLVDCLYHCANYYAEGNYVSNISPLIYNLQTYWNEYGAPTVKSTYDLENEEWDTTMYYLEENVNKVNETTNEYQLKYHGATAYISDVGSTELAEIYASQLPIFAN